MNLLHVRGARLAILFLVLVLVAVGLLTACSKSADKEPTAVIRTKSLEIVDDTGVTRVVLTTMEGGRPSLTLLDSSGNLRAMLFLGENGTPNLVLVDNPRIALLDKGGKIRSVQYLDENGSPIFTQLERNGGVRSMLRLDEGGQPAIQLYDTSGKPVWSAP